MSTSTLAAASTPMHAFDRKVNAIKASKSDINSVIMNYLISEGFPASARSFSKEANITHEPEDDELIQTRVNIKNAIHTGNIQDAIEMINELNPEILDLNDALHFSLLRLQLIELIRQSMASSDPKAIIPALHFSRDHLAPRASINPKFKRELEEAMSLIVYTHDKLEAPLLALLDPQLKQDVADRVNKAILKSLDRNSEAKIKALIKLRTWAEQKARDAGKDIVPPTLNIGLDQDKVAAQDEAMHENGQASGLDADAMVS